MRRLAVTAALALVASALVLTAPPASAVVTINVPASQPTIQAGIDAASDGDTVVVAPGTYFEHIDFKGKAIEVRGTPGTQPTVIDGGGTYHAVLFRSGEGRLSVLKGFTITNGAFPEVQPVVLAGAGIAINQASPTITQNLITGNDAGIRNGGGIGAVGGAPLIKDNYISDNHAGGVGGGVYAGADAEIVMNTVHGNTAGAGAGIHIYPGAPLVRDNVIDANHAGNGGGLFIDGGGEYINNVILENVADAAGGGVYVIAGSEPPTLLNNTIVRNQAATTGAGVAIDSGAPVIANSLIAGGPAQPLVSCAPGASPVFSHNDVFNGTPAPYAGCANPTGTNGNISADPLLISDGPNYVPDRASSTIDAGDNAAASLPIGDLHGNERVTDGNGDGSAVVDMGAVELGTFPGYGYTALTPARILDTRSGNGATAGRLGPEGFVALQVTGRGGVPDGGVSAVVLNVTVTEPTAVSFLTAWPAGTSRPLASNLNYAAGQTVANLVTVKVGTDGKVNLLNYAGSTHVIADVAGWYGSAGDRFSGVSPARILDTRNGAGPLAPGTPRTLQVTGQGGVPASGVSAVVLNVTVTNTGSGGWLAAWPAGEALPLVSNLNYIAGQTVPNLAIVKVGAGGAVNLYSSGGPVDVIADVAGYYADAGAGFASLPPARILDTRIGAGPLAPGTARTLQVTGQGGVPAAGVSAVVLNVTVTEPGSGGWLAAWPAGEALPVVSNLNYVPGQTVPNLVVVNVGAGGKVNLYTSGGPVHVIADVAGYFLTV
jgi:hypothetical protein